MTATSRADAPAQADRQGPARPERAPIRHIAAGVDGFPEGDDAAVLGAAIADAAGATLTLVSVQPEPLLLLPRELGWKAMHKQHREYLRKTRDRYAPEARTRVETDWSVARALERVVSRQHRDLLVVGSSRHADEGEVRIGKRTHQLLQHAPCALAVAPSGLSRQSQYRIGSIGVGFDGGPESLAAVSLAAWLARSAGVMLRIYAVVDDRLPAIGWSGLGAVMLIAEWDDVLDREAAELRRLARSAVRGAGDRAEIEVVRGRPADALLGLSGEVDLLVIGSRRWGAFARVMLGSTGESLMRGAACPLLVTPRRST